MAFDKTQRLEGLAQGSGSSSAEACPDYIKCQLETSIRFLVNDHSRFDLKNDIWAREPEQPSIGLAITTFSSMNSTKSVLPCADPRDVLIHLTLENRQRNAANTEHDVVKFLD